MMSKELEQQLREALTDAKEGRVQEWTSVEELIHSFDAKR